jgi:hypothetical protein
VTSAPAASRRAWSASTIRRGADQVAHRD